MQLKSVSAYQPHDLFDAVKPHISLVGGILSVDDTVVEKPYSNPKQAELINYFWSGKHHKAIKGINLITLYYSDTQGNAVPINYRIYDKQEEKTKNEYFRASGGGSYLLGFATVASHRRQLVFKRREFEISETPEIGFSIWG